jgi:hypothetical protein
MPTRLPNPQLEKTMDLKSTISRLTRFGVVRRYQGEYRAKVGHGTVAFRDLGGRCGRLRVFRDGQSSSCRSVAGALRSALHESELLVTSVGLLSVRIERQGRSLAPFAAFIITTVENQDHLRVEWAEDGWGDENAIHTAQGAIDGTMTAAVLLKWLERRGGDIAGFLAARQPV